MYPGADDPSTGARRRDTDGDMSSHHPRVHGIHSRVIGSVTLDETRLAQDISTMLSFPFNQGYSDYARGNPGWQNCVLMNHTGDPGDIAFGDHGAPKATPLLERLPYLKELLLATYDMEHLVWARIFMCHDGMLIPHRDYLDLPQDEFTRVHIPLQLGSASLHSEEGSVFRMRKGEIWFIDGTVNHAAYSYDGAPRIYLTADLRAGVPFDQLFNDPNTATNDVRPDFVDRPPLPESFAVTLDGMAAVLGPDNIEDVMSVLSKVHFHHDARCGDMYAWLIEVADRSGKPELIDLATEKRKFFLGV